VRSRRRGCRCLRLGRFSGRKKKKKEKVRWSVVSFFVGGGCSVLDITNEHGRASGHGTGVKGVKAGQELGRTKKAPIYIST
jgi:hypothetical protein